MVTTEKLEKLGLCATCKNAPTCAFPTDPQQARVECEEFESDGVALQAAGGCRAPLPRPRRARAARPGANHALGLCQNCQNRATCTFPRPEGGVWHCEEYR